MGKIYAKVFLAKLKILSVYKKDFYIGLVSSVLKALVGLLFIDFLFMNFDNIGGLSEIQMKYLYFSVGIIQSLMSFFFLGLVDFSNIYIKGGNLDIVLLKPLSTIPYIIADNINIKEFPNTMVHLVLFISTIKHLGLSFIASILLFIVPLSGVLFLVSFCLMINCLSFTYKDTLMGAKLIISLSDLTRYPLEIYSPFFRLLLLFVLPLGLSNYMPLNNINNLPFIVALSFFTSIIFCGIGYMLFKKSFTFYQGTGS